jgi:hypothetical protein
VAVRSEEGEVSEKFDVTKPPVEVARLAGRAPHQDPRRARLVVLGCEIELSEDYAWSASLLAADLGARFAKWAREIEAHCNESADQILADMTRDSVAYCTGYHKGADVLRDVLKLTLRKAQADASLAGAALFPALLALVDEARKGMPAPNADDAGFGRNFGEGE